MAELEEKQHGAGGYVREWLTRASHAPGDPTWVADGVASDRWRPISPVTGRLDAFVWQKPVERLSSGDEAQDAVFSSLPPPPSPLLIEEAQAAVDAPVAARSGAPSAALESADGAAAAPAAGAPDATPDSSAVEPSPAPKPEARKAWGIEYLFGRK